MFLLGRIVACLALLASITAFMPHMSRKMHQGSSQKDLQLDMSQTNINMPALSSTMKEGKIVSWNKKVGDKVNSGDVLLVVESDKADMDVEAFEGGYLAAIYTPEGKSAQVGDIVAVLVDTVAEIATVSSSSSAAAVASEPSAQSVATSTAVTEASAVPPAGSSNHQGNAPVIPDFEQITMPALSSTMKQGKIVSWSKKIGDKVSSGDVMLVVESDKADMDVESYEEGYLAFIAVKDGDTASVGSPVGYLAKKLADISALQAYFAAGGTVPMKDRDATAAADEPFLVIPAIASSSSTSTSASASATISSSAVVNSGRVAASGYAQQQAQRQGIDLSTVTPSRSDGYIISKDLATAIVSSSSFSSSVDTVHVPAQGSINASPTARKLAAEHNVDVNTIKGSGNFGRVMPNDVLKAVGKYVTPVTTSSTGSATAVDVSENVRSPTASNDVLAPVSLDGLVAMDGMQKAVAKNMEKTLSVPVFKVSREIVTDEFDALYAKLKDKGVSVSALLAKAVAVVLKKHPLLNAAYDLSGAIKYNKDINIAMAVAIDGGLITPTIGKAGELDLFTIGRTWKDLVARAKSKKLTAAEYSSGTFTISNLGMFGVKEFGAILPPGTGSILAVSAALPKVVQLKNGHFGVQKSMTVTITCDHRHIYGADAAQFLKDLADLLENDVQSLTMG